MIRAPEPLFAAEQPFPPGYFEWFVTALVIIPALSWVVVDIVRLRRALAGKELPAHDRRDRIFGSMIGLLVASMGITGSVLYHLR